MPVTPHSHTSAERISLSVHSQFVTSHGCIIRVSFAAAARSVTTFASLCVCRNDAGMASVMCPSTVFCIMSALSSPHAVRNIFLAERMVLTPIVIEQGGTGS